MQAELGPVADRLDRAAQHADPRRPGDVDYQAEFLSKGPDFIQPLKMQQIATGRRSRDHVSRAVDDKWIQTPRGIFPLKRFFCGGTVSADGEEVAWDTVRLKLQEIVDGENKQNPLSDEDLVVELGKHGIKARAHRDQVPQGDADPQLAPTPRLGAERRRKGDGERRKEMRRFGAERFVRARVAPGD